MHLKIFNIVHFGEALVAATKMMRLGQLALVKSMPEVRIVV
jgi:hypothetical protein